MRIIAGTHRGRRLLAPSDQKIRPTSDRVRESLFSIIGNIQDLVILDAFAGTGALGLEAISRGAKFVYFFDTSKTSTTIVRENIDLLEFKKRARIITGALTKNTSLVDEKVDLVFLDPPYNKNLITPALNALVDSKLLVSDALIILEHEAREEIEIPDSFEFDECRKYGKTTLTFLYGPTYDDPSSL